MALLGNASICLCSQALEVVFILYLPVLWSVIPWFIEMEKSLGPFPSSAYAYLSLAEARHWWFQSRNNIIIWTLKSRVRLSSGSSLLEVGCGSGFVTSGISKAFPAVRLEATEYFEEGLVFARQRVPACIFKRLDATQMTEDGIYDCIGSFDVIEHIEADELVLSNFFRAIRRGGRLLLTVPQHPWLWSAADEYAHHVRRYTRSDLCNKVSRAGFRVEYCTSFVSLLLPLMALHRVSQRNNDYNPDDEFRISPLLNSLLYLVMFVERLLLKLGLRFPAGGSLLLLAHKP
ncbi:class I SAM-dependent methyltransferase [Synechococcus sp. FGCU-3]|nr:class I SAM-dependent methyltransferase [Synechococcus sp. FGCU3]